jgi:hypothetical protein
MIDIHPPQHAPITKREFFIHLFIVVLGILIAIGLEQTVEYLHHRHQAEHAERSLRQESLENRALVRQDLPSIAQAQQLVRANMAALDRTTLAPPTPFHPVPYLAHTYVLTPHNVAWLALRDSQLLWLMPQTLSDTYWEMDYDRSLAQEGNAEIVQRRQEVETLLHLHADPATLSSEERERLLLAFGALDQSLTNMRQALLIYNTANEAALSGKQFNPNGVFQDAGVR